MAKGMILAAGQGTRVRPLTKDWPKPMVPILGKPVMEYLIEHLARYGITEIMVNVAYHHRKIEEYFGDGRRWGVNIGYSFEGVYDHGDILPKPKGSAGGMKAIRISAGSLMRRRWSCAAMQLSILISVQPCSSTGAKALWRASLRWRFPMTRFRITALW